MTPTVAATTSSTDANARLTIAAGLACTAAGDTLLIGNGTYAERITSWPSGTSANVVSTVRAENNLQVIIEPASGTQGMLFFDEKWIVLDGVVVDATNVTSTGILFSGTSSDITLQNIEVKNAKGTAGSDGSGSCIATNIRLCIKIIRASVHDCGALENSGHSHGIYLSGPYSLVERSEIYNTTGHGVHQFHTGIERRE